MVIHHCGRHGGMSVVRRQREQLPEKRRGTTKNRVTAQQKGPSCNLFFEFRVAERVYESGGRKGDVKKVEENIRFTVKRRRIELNMTKVQTNITFSLNSPS